MFKTAAKLTKKYVPEIVYSLAVKLYLNWLHSIYLNASEEFFDRFEEAMKEKECLEKFLKKCPSDIEELEKWLAELATEDGLLSYKRSNIEVVKALSNEKSGTLKQVAENKAKVINNLVLKQCLFEQINTTLNKKISELETNLDASEYPQVNSMLDDYHETLSQIQLADAFLIILSEKICEECSESELPLTEPTRRDLELTKKKIEEQKNQNYEAVIKKLAKNIYLNKVEKTLQELDNHLKNNGLATGTINEIKQEFQAEIKNIPFPNLENWKEKKLEIILKKKNMNSEINWEEFKAWVEEKHSNNRARKEEWDWFFSTFARKHLEYNSDLKKDLDSWDSKHGSQNGNYRIIARIVGEWLKEKEEEEVVSKNEYHWDKFEEWVEKKPNQGGLSGASLDYISSLIKEGKELPTGLGGDLAREWMEEVDANVRRRNKITAKFSELYVRINKIYWPDDTINITRGSQTILGEFNTSSGISEETANRAIAIYQNFLTETGYSTAEIQEILKNDLTETCPLSQPTPLGKIIQEESADIAYLIRETGYSGIEPISSFVEGGEFAWSEDIEEMEVSFLGEDPVEAVEADIESLKKAITKEINLISQAAIGTWGTDHLKNLAKSIKLWKIRRGCEFSGITSNKDAWQNFGNTNNGRLRAAINDLREDFTPDNLNELEKICTAHQWYFYSYINDDNGKRKESFEPIPSLINQKRIEDLRELWEKKANISKNSVAQSPIDDGKSFFEPPKNNTDFNSRRWTIHNDESIQKEITNQGPANFSELLKQLVSLSNAVDQKIHKLKNKSFELEKRYPLKEKEKETEKEKEKEKEIVITPRTGGGKTPAEIHEEVNDAGRLLDQIAAIWNDPNGSEHKPENAEAWKTVRDGYQLLLMFAVQHADNLNNKIATMEAESNKSILILETTLEKRDKEIDGLKDEKTALKKEKNDLEREKNTLEISLNKAANDLEIAKDEAKRFQGEATELEKKLNDEQDLHKAANEMIKEKNKLITDINKIFNIIDDTNEDEVQQINPSKQALYQAIEKFIRDLPLPVIIKENNNEKFDNKKAKQINDRLNFLDKVDQIFQIFEKNNADNHGDFDESRMNELFVLIRDNISNHNKIKEVNKKIAETLEDKGIEKDKIGIIGKDSTIENSLKIVADNLSKLITKWDNDSQKKDEYEKKIREIFELENDKEIDDDWENSVKKWKENSAAADKVNDKINETNKIIKVEIENSGGKVTEVPGENAVDFNKRLVQEGIPILKLAKAKSAKQALLEEAQGTLNDDQIKAKVNERKEIIFEKEDWKIFLNGSINEDQLEIRSSLILTAIKNLKFTDLTETKTKIKARIEAARSTITAIKHADLKKKINDTYGSGAEIIANPNVENATTLNAWIDGATNADDLAKFEGWALDANRLVRTDLTDARNKAEVRLNVLAQSKVPGANATAKNDAVKTWLVDIAKGNETLANGGDTWQTWLKEADSAAELSRRSEKLVEGIKALEADLTETKTKIKARIEAARSTITAIKHADLKKKINDTYGSGAEIIANPNVENATTLNAWIDGATNADDLAKFEGWALDANRLVRTDLTDARNKAEVRLNVLAQSKVPGANATAKNDAVKTWLVDIAKGNETLANGGDTWQTWLKEADSAAELSRRSEKLVEGIKALEADLTETKTKIKARIEAARSTITAIKHADLKKKINDTYGSGAEIIANPNVENATTLNAWIDGATNADDLAKFEGWALDANRLVRTDLTDARNKAEVRLNVLAQSKVPGANATAKNDAVKTWLVDIAKGNETLANGGDTWQTWLKEADSAAELSRRSEKLVEGIKALEADLTETKTKIKARIEAARSTITAIKHADLKKKINDTYGSGAEIIANPNVENATTLNAWIDGATNADDLAKFEGWALDANRLVRTDLTDARNKAEVRLNVLAQSKVPGANATAKNDAVKTWLVDIAKGNETLANGGDTWQTWLKEADSAAELSRRSEKLVEGIKALEADLTETKTKIKARIEAARSTITAIKHADLKKKINDTYGSGAEIIANPNVENATTLNAWIDGATNADDLAKFEGWALDANRLVRTDLTDARNKAEVRLNVLAQSKVPGANATAKNDAVKTWLVDIAKGNETLANGGDTWQTWLKEADSAAELSRRSEKLVEGIKALEADLTETKTKIKARIEAARSTITAIKHADLKKKINDTYGSGAEIIANPNVENATTLNAWIDGATNADDLAKFEGWALDANRLVRTDLTDARNKAEVRLNVLAQSKVPGANATAKNDAVKTWLVDIAKGNETLANGGDTWQTWLKEADSAAELSRRSEKLVEGIKALEADLTETKTKIKARIEAARSTITAIKHADLKKKINDTYGSGAEIIANPNVENATTLNAWIDGATNADDLAKFEGWALDANRLVRTDLTDARNKAEVRLNVLAQSKVPGANATAKNDAVKTWLVDIAKGNETLANGGDTWQTWLKEADSAAELSRRSEKLVEGIKALEADLTETKTKIKARIEAARSTITAIKHADLKKKINDTYGSGAEIIANPNVENATTLNAWIDGATNADDLAKFEGWALDANRLVRTDLTDARNKAEVRLNVLAQSKVPGANATAKNDAVKTWLVDIAKGNETLANGGDTWQTWLKEADSAAELSRRSEKLVEGIKALEADLTETKTKIKARIEAARSTITAIKHADLKKKINDTYGSGAEIIANPNVENATTLNAWIDGATNADDLAKFEGWALDANRLVRTDLTDARNKAEVRLNVLAQSKVPGANATAKNDAVKTWLVDIAKGNETLANGGDTWQTWLKEADSAAELSRRSEKLVEGIKALEADLTETKTKIKARIEAARSTITAIKHADLKKKINDTYGSGAEIIANPNVENATTLNAWIDGATNADDLAKFEGWALDANRLVRTDLTDARNKAEVRLNVLAQSKVPGANATAKNDAVKTWLVDIAKGNETLANGGDTWQTWLKEADSAAELSRRSEKLVEGIKALEADLTETKTKIKARIEAARSTITAIKHADLKKKINDTYGSGAEIIANPNVENATTLNAWIDGATNADDLAKFEGWALDANRLVRTDLTDARNKAEVRLNVLAQSKVPGANATAKNDAVKTWLVDIAKGNETLANGGDTWQTWLKEADSAAELSRRSEKLVEGIKALEADLTETKTKIKARIEAARSTITAIKHADLKKKINDTYGSGAEIIANPNVENATTLNAWIDGATNADDLAKFEGWALDANRLVRTDLTDARNKAEVRLNVLAQSKVPGANATAKNDAVKTWLVDIAKGNETLANGGDTWQTWLKEADSAAELSRRSEKLVEGIKALEADLTETKTKIKARIEAARSTITAIKHADLKKKINDTYGSGAEIIANPNVENATTLNAWIDGATNADDLAKFEGWALDANRLVRTDLTDARNKAEVRLNVLAQSKVPGANATAKNDAVKTWLVDIAKGNETLANGGDTWQTWLKEADSAAELSRRSEKLVEGIKALEADLTETKTKIKARIEAARSTITAIKHADLKKKINDTYGSGAEIIANPNVENATTLNAWIDGATNADDLAKFEGWALDANRLVRTDLTDARNKAEVRLNVLAQSKVPGANATAKNDAVKTWLVDIAKGNETLANGGDTWQTWLKEADSAAELSRRSEKLVEGIKALEADLTETKTKIKARIEAARSTITAIKHADLKKKINDTYGSGAEIIANPNVENATTLNAWIDGATNADDLAKFEGWALDANRLVRTDLTDARNKAEVRLNVLAQSKVPGANATAKNDAVKTWLVDIAKGNETLANGGDTWQTWLKEADSAAELSRRSEKLVEGIKALEADLTETKTKIKARIEAARSTITAIKHADLKKKINDTYGSGAEIIANPNVENATTLNAWIDGATNADDLAKFEGWALDANRLVRTDLTDARNKAEVRLNVLAQSKVPGANATAKNDAVKTWLVDIAKGNETLANGGDTWQTWLKEADSAAELSRRSEKLVEGIKALEADLTETKTKIKARIEAARSTITAIKHADLKKKINDTYGSGAEIIANPNVENATTLNAWIDGATNADDLAKFEGWALDANRLVRTDLTDARNKAEVRLNVLAQSKVPGANATAKNDAVKTWLVDIAKGNETLANGGGHLANLVKRSRQCRGIIPPQRKVGGRD